MMTRWIPVVVRKSIRNKLALSIFLGVVIVLALISHYRFRQLYSRFQNHFETSSSLSTQLAIRETELWFTDNLKLIESIAYDLSLLAQFVDYDQMDISDIVRRHDKRIYIGFEDGFTKNSENFFQSQDGFDPRTRPWYQLVLESREASFIEPYPDAFTKKMTVTFAAPVMNAEGHLAGVVAYDVLFDDLLMLIGKIFSRNVEDMIYTKKNNELFILIKEPGFFTAQNMEALDFEVFRDPSKSPYRAKIQDKEFLFVFGYAPLNRLHIIYPVDLEKLFLPLRRLSVSAFFMHILGVSLVTMVVWFITGIFTKPLKTLSVSARKVATGDFDIQLRPQSLDEVGELTGAFNHMVKGLKERDMVKNFFGKYVGQAVMQDVLQKKSLELGGTLAHISVLFCDIRNFTSIAESLTPEKTVKMLNIYFSEIVQCIDSHKGYLDKYLGDGLLVVFGAPVKVKEHAQHACLAALDFVNSLERVNEKLRKEELPQIDIGVGIHSGDAVVGNIGAAQRMEYSVIGDTVNVASRVERLTRDFDKKILLTQETVDLLSGEFELDSIGCHLVKGKKSEICLYELKSRIKNLTKLSL